MNVNGKTVTSAYVKQHSVNFKSRSIEGLTRWPSVRSGQPAALSPGRLGAATCDVVLVIRVPDTTRDVDLIARQTLAKFEGFLDVEFDGMDFGFVGTMKSYELKTEMAEYWKTLTLHLEGDKVGPAEKRVVVWDTSDDTSFTLNNPGNLPTPCYLHVQGGIYCPSIDDYASQHDIVELSVAGLMRDPFSLAAKSYILRSPWRWVHDVDARTGTDALFESGAVVDVTGLKSSDRNVTVKERVITAYRFRGRITRDGRYGQRFIESFGLPILMPGANTITCTRLSSEVPLWQTRGVRFIIEYRPVYA